LFLHSEPSHYVVYIDAILQPRLLRKPDKETVMKDNGHARNSIHNLKEVDV